MLITTYLSTIRYLSVSLSPTLSRNEKVEQYIKKKTHKPNALKFWVEDDVIFLCGFDLVLILVRRMKSITLCHVTIMYCIFLLSRREMKMLYT